MYCVAGTYDEYLAHQCEKTLDPANREGSRIKEDRRIREFRESFAVLDGIVSTNGRGLCMGARYGEEVRAFHQLGYANVHGIDLVACPPWVSVGDMHSVECEDRAFEFVFSNALDHLYSLQDFADEVSRITTTAALFHVALNNHGPYESMIIESVGEVVDAMSDWTLAHEGPCGYQVDVLTVLLFTR
jgi:hypothetical protein